MKTSDVMKFQLKPVLTVFTAISIGLLLSLGMWQLHRLAWKDALIAKVEARTNSAPIPFTDAVRRADAGEDMEYAPVVMQGSLLEQKQARVFGTYDGAPGVYVFTPLETRGVSVYVNRGFAPQSVAGDDCFCDPNGNDEDRVTGYFRTAEQPSPPASWFQLRGKSADGLWFIRDPAAFAAEAEIAAAPYYIDQFEVIGRDWPKGGTTRLEFSNRHFEYALTWFGLAATLAGVWLAFSLQKPN